jgi:hypothetical protein
MLDIQYDPELNRDRPSAKYTELLDQYITMHSSAKGMFDGKSLTKFIYIIDGFLKSNKCKSLLDYGAGKGTLYTENYKKLTNVIDKPLTEYWELDKIDRYEPALAEYNVLSSDEYDAVICTDVLEHVPETDLGWVVDEIDGTNVHVSVFEPNVWLNFFLDKIRNYKNLSIYLFFDVMNANHKAISLEGFKIDNNPRVIQLRQEERDDRNT